MEPSRCFYQENRPLENWVAYLKLEQPATRTMGSRSVRSCEMSLGPRQRSIIANLILSRSSR
jgi:hypothetical protein